MTNPANYGTFEVEGAEKCSRFDPHFQLKSANIMFDFLRKRQPVFGNISTTDDRDIEIHRVKNSSRNGIVLESFKLLRDIFLVLAVFVLLMVFVAQPVVVEGTSMLPQLHDGERLIVNKLIYYKIPGVTWGNLQRGDVVVFWYPNDPDKSYVKRVIGLPGETIEIRNGIVYVDGEQMKEEYLATDFHQRMDNHAPKKVDEHHYYVMGDNRDNSSDSRIWGVVPEKYIYGKVFFRYWIPSKFGSIPRGIFELDESKKESQDNKTDTNPDETDR